MRTVRNIVNTGRTIACTIHQPSIDIFEVWRVDALEEHACSLTLSTSADCLLSLAPQAFDELLLLKRGGVTIYAGKLGRLSQVMVDYFESIDGVPLLAENFNPATWYVP